MLPYTEQVLRKECSDCVEQFALIQEAIGEASFEQVKKQSCHVLCTEVGELFDLKVEHGYFMSKPAFEHSWCVDRCGNIIDVYPWGGYWWGCAYRENRSESHGTKWPI